MATLEFGPDGAKAVDPDSADYGPWHDCVVTNLKELADNPDLGRVAPLVPFGWWPGLMHPFHCDGPRGVTYFTAFYLRTETGIRVESLGINRA